MGRLRLLYLSIGDVDVDGRVERRVFDHEALESEVGGARRDPDRVVHRSIAARVNDRLLTGIVPDRDRSDRATGARHHHALDVDTAANQSGLTGTQDVEGLLDRPPG